MIRRLRASTDAKIHDYTRRYWGHDYSLTPDPNPATARVVGWGDDLSAGDFLILPGSKGGLVIYLLKELDYYWDPSDMWHGRARFVPGSSKLGRRVAAAAAEPTPRGWWPL